MTTQWISLNNYKQNIWKTKPNFTEKPTLGDKDKVITKGNDFYIRFKDHFRNVVETLKTEYPALSNVSNDSALNAIEKFS